MEDNKINLHAVLIPLPLQGHVIPFVHLALKLASNGLTVTFVNTHSIDHVIVESRSQRTAGDIFAKARDDSGLDIRYATIDDGSPLDFDLTLHHDQFFKRFLEVVSDRVDELVGKLSEEGPRVNCLIADTFYAWPSVVAEKHGLVNVSFWTEPLLVFTLYYHWDLLRSHGHCGPQDNEQDTEIDYVPGVGSIKPKDLMSYLQSDDTTSVVARAIREDFEHVNKVDLIISNTVAELEPETLATLNKKWPVYPIGPILPIGVTKGSVATSMWSESDCTHWLDTKPKGSVLYVSFGSWAPTTKKVIWEIAHGLLLSGVSFIWVLRPDTISSDKIDLLLPSGFDDQVKDRGLIVSWCYQIDVISHSSIGAFLTHCGWNSILESMWCSVPLLCYPLVSDQPTNRKLVVDDWQIGINLCEGKSITRAEVAAKINSLMTRKSAEELKERMKNTRNKLANALASTGSSGKNLAKFINDVKDRIIINQKYVG